MKKWIKNTIRTKCSLRTYQYFHMTDKLIRQGWLLRNIRNFILQKFHSAELEYHERMWFSQNGEDGIIREIFRRIGKANSFCIEFGIHPQEGNTLLLKKKGWNCLWMDGDGDGVSIKKEFIYADNINALFKKYHVPVDVDLLSIDIDGNDYWVWNAVAEFKPRVVVIEYNAMIPSDESRTIPYTPEFRWDGTDYYGASLKALYELGNKKGYQLIYCDSKGVNAFFVRQDLIQTHFKLRPLNDLYRRPKFGLKKDGQYIGHAKSDQVMMDIGSMT